MASLLLRGAGKQAIAAATRPNSLFMVKSCGPMTAMSTAQAYKDMENFWAKNRKLNRPLSPHLSIYKPQLTSGLSLCHRVTGIAMALTVSGASLFFLAAPGDFTHYLNLVQSLEISGILITAAKYVLAIPVCYHYINGIRHLAWDWALGFGLQRLYNTGYFVVAMTFIVASAFVFGLK